MSGPLKLSSTTYLLFAGSWRDPRVRRPPEDAVNQRRAGIPRGLQQEGVRRLHHKQDQQCRVVLLLRLIVLREDDEEQLVLQFFVLFFAAQQEGADPACSVHAGAQAAAASTAATEWDIPGEFIRHLTHLFTLNKFELIWFKINLIDHKPHLSENDSPWFRFVLCSKKLNFQWLVQ